MTRRRIALLALAATVWVLAAASCGRYGKPVRPSPEPAPAAAPADRDGTDAQEAGKR